MHRLSQLRLLFWVIVVLQTTSLLAQSEIPKTNLPLVELIKQSADVKAQLVRLSNSLQGKLKPCYREREDSQRRNSLDLSFTHALPRCRGLGAEQETTFTLCSQCNETETEGSVVKTDFQYTAPATYMKSLPDLEALKQFETIKQFVAVFGKMRGYSDGHSHQWLVFTVTGEDTIKVMSVSLNHGIGNDRAPLGLSIDTGVFRPQ